MKAGCKGRFLMDWDLYLIGRAQSTKILKKNESSTLKHLGTTFRALKSLLTFASTWGNFCCICTGVSFVPICQIAYITSTINTCIHVHKLIVDPAFYELQTATIQPNKYQSEQLPTSNVFSSDMKLFTTFGFTLPLAATRTWLYFTSTITSFFLLVPVSLIAYHVYYTTLIPDANSPSIPLDFITTKITTPVKSAQFGRIYKPGQFVSLSSPIDPQSITSEENDNGGVTSFTFDKDSLYTFKLNLALYCDHQFAYDTSIHTVYYSLQSNLKPIKYDEDYDRWEYGSDEPVFKSGSFILDCDPNLSHGLRNKFVPQALRNWVPPLFIDYRKYRTIEIDAFDIYGSGLLQNEHFVKTYEKSPSQSSFSLILQTQEDSSSKVQRVFTIDSNASFAQFTLKLTGFRYFMAKYFFTFYFIGSLIFYIICCVVTFITGYGILFTRSRPSGVARR
ncbi:hypothetical protein CORT_0C01770 [Candida orthopsilosis Co 90-125]|uniref:Uncharacterized protein n=1 Tax=Candida orthopsilosis (strain 90-125) TaxID=1136231 RepID=H8X2K7_CANO9|nr:hypothetical protein CORT_0C01770 [Candida orthopsilosis Co 90-125]CCG25554.1 hypothetical protein CORT_0C01770 [Candida orthopsilosis Co 90-125]